MKKFKHTNEELELAKQQSEKDKRKKSYSSDFFSFFSFSDCNLANSNSSFVCLNFFNLTLVYNLDIKTAHFMGSQSKRENQYPTE